MRPVQGTDVSALCKDSSDIDLLGQQGQQGQQEQQGWFPA